MALKDSVVSEYCINYKSNRIINESKAFKPETNVQEQKQILENDNILQAVENEIDDKIQYKEKKHFILGATFIVAAIVVSAYLSVYLYMNIEHFANINLF